MRYTQADVDRFWRHVEKKESGCWEWQGVLVKEMYGQFRLGKKAVSAHRFSYTVANGKIRLGKVIRHQCNNPRCVNPAHLLDGWHEDNTADIVRSASRKRVLTDAEQATIRAMHADGKTRREIAEALHCGFYAVSGFMERDGMKAQRMGRPKGSKNRKVRFPEDVKRQIIADYRSGMTQQQVAEKHGCDQTYVSLLSKRAA